MNIVVPDQIITDLCIRVGPTKALQNAIVRHVRNLIVLDDCPRSVSDHDSGCPLILLTHLSDKIIANDVSERYDSCIFWILNNGHIDVDRIAGNVSEHITYDRIGMCI